MSAPLKKKIVSSREEMPDAADAGQGAPFSSGNGVIGWVHKYGM